MMSPTPRFLFLGLPRVPLPSTDLARRGVRVLGDVATCKGASHKGAGFRHANT